MSLLSVDVPPADVIGDALRLHLGPNALPAVAAIRVPVGPHRVLVLEVLAASHRVTLLLHGRPALVETVACATGSPLDAEPVDPYSLPTAHAVDLEPGGYRFTSERRDGHGAVTDAARHVRTLSGRGDALTVGFPGHPDALTGLAVASGPPATLAWSTWHLYPGATPHVVATTSIIELREVA
ncbi:MAG TPA: DUF2617 family protein [Acidimicrobiales bacterium]|jgi:hypothetical protein|nr:DUF2617 family protein [Acidimicrobiales bacterium]HRA34715.1 DUF2617 family protein [Acidimicrobiales bacterium]